VLEDAKVTPGLLIDEQSHGLPHPIGIQSVVNLAAFEKLLGFAPCLFRYLQIIILLR